jgi:hypothetical protein
MNAFTNVCLLDRPRNHKNINWLGDRAKIGNFLMSAVWSYNEFYSRISSLLIKQAKRLKMPLSMALGSLIDVETEEPSATQIMTKMVRMPPKPPKAAPKPKTTKGEAQRRREIEHQTAAASSEDEPDDDSQLRFQEAHGSRLFRQGKPRAVLEVKSPNIPTAMYEARLRGYDKAAAKENTSKLPKK